MKKTNFISHQTYDPVRGRPKTRADTEFFRCVFREIDFQKADLETTLFVGCEFFDCVLRKDHKKEEIFQVCTFNDVVWY